MCVAPINLIKTFKKNCVKQTKKIHVIKFQTENNKEKLHVNII